MLVASKYVVDKLKLMVLCYTIIHSLQVQPGNTTVLPLMANETRRLEVPQLHPRFRVLGIALDHSGEELARRVNVAELER